MASPCKKGTFVDRHGKDHVVKQRENFVKYYKEVYDRGPNFVLINGIWVDKDKVKGVLETSLTKAEHCIGPHGINMGGAPRPSTGHSKLSFTPNHIDRITKILIIVCHDECCVHTNEGQAYCWKIPGIEMGDCPPKSKGDIMHLADANAELEPGCFSLDGELGTYDHKERNEELHCSEACWRGSGGPNAQHHHHARRQFRGGVLGGRGCHDAIRADV